MIVDSGVADFDHHVVTLEVCCLSFRIQVSIHHDRRNRLAAHCSRSKAPDLWLNLTTLSVL